MQARGGFLASMSLETSVEDPEKRRNTTKRKLPESERVEVVVVSLCRWVLGRERYGKTLLRDLACENEKT